MTVVDEWIDPFWVAYVIYGASLTVIVVVIILAVRYYRSRQRGEVGVVNNAPPRFDAGPTYAFGPRTAFTSSAMLSLPNQNSDTIMEEPPSIAAALMETSIDNPTVLKPPGTPKGILRKENRPKKRRVSSVRMSDQLPGEIGDRVPSLRRKLSFRRSDGTSEVRVEEYSRSDETESVRSTLERRLSQRMTLEQLVERRILLRFDDRVQVQEVELYDRKGDPTWVGLTGEQKASIRKELNEFKKTEMEVHEESRKFTRFHDEPGGAAPAVRTAVAPISTSLPSLHVGQRVFVRGFGTGTLRFLGPHHLLSTIRCGVELDAPCGLNNGVVGGHEYFTCDDKHGVLCDPRMVTPSRASLTLAPATTETTAQSSSSTSDTEAESSDSEGGPSMLVSHL